MATKIAAKQRGQPAVTPQHSVFAKRLKTAMSRAQLTASDLATTIWGRREAIYGGETYMVAKNRDQISAYLAGHRLPRYKTLCQIALALKTTPLELAPELALTTPLVANSEVSVTMLPADKGESMASLQVTSVLPATIALHIAELIAKVRNAEATQAAQADRTAAPELVG